MDGESAIEAIRRAALSVAAETLFEAAALEGPVFSGPRTASVAIGEAYATPDALRSAVESGAPTAIVAALRGVSRLDGERLVEAALALVSARSTAARPLKLAAWFALARSTREEALRVLLEALEPRSEIPTGALAASVHPDATRRTRRVLAAAELDAFEPCPAPTLEQWHALTDAERARIGALQPAGSRPAAVQRAHAAIFVLGMRRDVETLELLPRLLDAHPDPRLRTVAAHALAKFEDPRAQAALDRRWSDADAGIGTICVRAAVHRDLRTAWTRFAPHLTPLLDGAGTMTNDVVVTRLFHVLDGGVRPRRTAPEQDPLHVEPRFVEAAARLRHHAAVGSSARSLLELLSRERQHELVARYPRPAWIRAPALIPSRRDFLARYEGGEHSAWDDLVRHAGAIAEHVDLAEEARAVAHSLMLRVLRNRDALRAVLTSAGASLGAEARPAENADLARLIAMVGPLPLALEAFWKVVGSIDLLPAADYDYGPCTLEDDGLSLIALDPLSICGADVGWMLDEYEERVAGSHVEIVGPLRVDFAPDFLHKQNISGGAPYAVELPPPSPAGAVDPDVLDERHATTLVGYLRACMDWGGFSLLEVAARPLNAVGLNERMAFEGVRGPWRAASERLRARLCRDLVAF